MYLYSVFTWFIFLLLLSKTLFSVFIATTKALSFSFEKDSASLFFSYVSNVRLLNLVKFTYLQAQNRGCYLTHSSSVWLTCPKNSILSGCFIWAAPYAERESVKRMHLSVTHITIGLMSLYPTPGRHFGINSKRK